MKNGKFRKTFGLILLLLQVVSIFSLFIAGAGFFHPAEYEIRDHFEDPRYGTDYLRMPEYDFTIEELAVSYLVGTEKLAVSFDCLYDLLLSEDMETPRIYYDYPFSFSGSYVTAHEPEYLSLRRSLETYSFWGLRLFDLVCLIGYLLPGILGIILLAKGSSFSNFPVPASTLPDVPYRKRDSWLKPVGIAIPLAGALLLIMDLAVKWKYLRLDEDQLGAYLAALIRLDRSALAYAMLVCSMICLCVFFAFYFLKQRSILFPATLIFFGLSELFSSCIYWRILLLDAIVYWDDLLTLELLLLSAIGILSLIAGLMLYRDKPRKSVRGLITTVFSLTALHCSLPALLETDSSIYAFLPLLLMGICMIYVFTANPYVMAEDSAARSTSAEWRCTCGRVHGSFVSSCICGVAKRDVVK